MRGGIVVFGAQGRFAPAPAHPLYGGFRGWFHNIFLNGTLPIKSEYLFKPIQKTPLCHT